MERYDAGRPVVQIRQARLLALEHPLGRWSAFCAVPLTGLFPSVFGGLLFVPSTAVQVRNGKTSLTLV